MRITVEDIKEYKKNAIEILRNNSQYATAKAVEMAFDALVYFEQVFHRKEDSVYLTKKEYEELLEYKFMYENLNK